jgi:PKD repeat protein
MKEAKMKMRGLKNTSCFFIVGFVLLVVPVSAYSQGFSAWGFSCTRALDDYVCSLSYYNQLGEDATVLFLFADSKGKVVKAIMATAPIGSGTVKVQFYCSLVQPGTYRVPWRAYRASDSELANEIAWSKSETQQIYCPSMIDKKYAQYAQHARLRAYLTKAVMEGFRQKIETRGDVQVKLDKLTEDYLRSLGQRYIEEIIKMTGDPILSILVTKGGLDIEGIIKDFQKWTNEMLKTWMEDQNLKQAEKEGLPSYLTSLWEEIEEEAEAWEAYSKVRDEYNRQAIEGALLDQAASLGAIAGICDHVNSLSDPWRSKLLDNLAKLARKIYWDGVLLKEWVEWLGNEREEIHSSYIYAYNYYFYKSPGFLGPPQGQLGDVNRDGAVDSLDALLILQFSVGLISENDLAKDRADVNGDGGIDSLDALLILQKSVGLISDFPVSRSASLSSGAVGSVEPLATLKPMQAGQVTVTIGSADINPGETATIDVTASNIPSPGLGSFDIEIKFNPDIAEFISAEAGDPLFAGTFFSNEKPKGVVSISAAQAQKTPSQLTLARLRFKAVGSPGASTSLQLTVKTLADASAPPKRISASPINGNFSIKGGVAPKQPRIQVTSTRLDFGEVQLNTSADRTLTIRNTGEERLNIANISTDNPVFTVKGSTSFSINPGNFVDVTVTFTPKVEGSQSGKLSISSNDPEKPTLTIQLSGTGFAPKPGQPMASFTFSPQSPNVGDTITFDATSSTPGAPGGSIISYSWDFGDGSTGTGRNVTHAYTTQGNFTVKLVVTDDQGRTASASRTVPVGVVSHKKLKEVVAGLIPGDPAGVSNPDVVIGDGEILQAIDMWLKKTLVPGTNQILDRETIRVELIPYWVEGVPVTQAISIEAARAASITASTKALGHSVIASRKISAHKVRPGEAFQVTITIKVDEDTSLIGITDSLPAGWQAEGQGNSEFFLELKAGDIKTLSYWVTVPSDVEAGSYKVTGAVKSLFADDEPIGGDSEVQVEVSGDGVLSVPEAIAGDDSIIDDSEIISAIQLWINGEVVPETGRTISDEEILELIAYWISDTKVDQPIPQVSKQSLNEELNSLIARAGEGKQLSIRAFNIMPSPSRGGKMSFRVEGIGIRSIKAEVYDLTGKQVFDSGFVGGRELSWDLTNAQGKPLANGVYLYVITVRGYDGQVIKSEVRKLVVLR